MYNTREKMMNILSSVYFAKLRDVVKYFSLFNQKSVKKTLVLLYHQFQELLNGEK